MYSTPFLILLALIGLLAAAAGMIYFGKLLTKGDETVEEE